MVSSDVLAVNINYCSESRSLKDGSNPILIQASWGPRAGLDLLHFITFVALKYPNTRAGLATAMGAFLTGMMAEVSTTYSTRVGQCGNGPLHNSRHGMPIALTTVCLPPS